MVKTITLHVHEVYATQVTTKMGNRAADVCTFSEHVPQQEDQNTAKYEYVPVIPLHQVSNGRIFYSFFVSNASGSFTFATTLLLCKVSSKTGATNILTAQKRVKSYTCHDNTRFPTYTTTTRLLHFRHIA